MKLFWFSISEIISLFCHSGFLSFGKWNDFRWILSEFMRYLWTMIPFLQNADKWFEHVIFLLLNRQNLRRCFETKATKKFFKIFLNATRSNIMTSTARYDNDLQCYCVETKKENAFKFLNHQKSGHLAFSLLLPLSFPHSLSLFFPLFSIPSSLLSSFFPPFLPFLLFSFLSLKMNFHLYEWTLPFFSNSHVHVFHIHDTSACSQGKFQFHLVKKWLKEFPSNFT